MGTREARQRPTPAKDRAYAFVKEQILEGVYPGGELLSEGEVAQALGVSRTPVREAFLLLEAEGLMRLYPKRGALVVPVSAQEIHEVLETRLLVERHAAARAAVHERAELGRELKELLSDQQRHLVTDNRIGFVEADRLFHRAIVAQVGNGILNRLYDSLRDRQRRMGAAALAREPELQARYLAEHRRIAAAIGAGDAEETCRLIEDHLEGAREDYAAIGAAAP
jgi:DNA-binding GntR family transcriptional regulator